MSGLWRLKRDLLLAAVPPAILSISRPVDTTDKFMGVMNVQYVEQRLLQGDGNPLLCVVWLKTKLCKSECKI